MEPKPESEEWRDHIREKITEFEVKSRGNFHDPEMKRCLDYIDTLEEQRDRAVKVLQRIVCQEIPGNGLDQIVQRIHLECEEALDDIEEE